MHIVCRPECSLKEARAGPLARRAPGRDVCKHVEQTRPRRKRSEALVRRRPALLRHIDADAVFHAVRTGRSQLGRCWLLRGDAGTCTQALDQEAQPVKLASPPPLRLDGTRSDR
eukprot:2337150-Prymnesium_polylepis.1